MSASRRARSDDDSAELALDRPGLPAPDPGDAPPLDRPGSAAVEPWRPRQPIQARPDPVYPDRTHPREPRYVDGPGPRRSADVIGTLSGLVGLAFKLTFLLILVTMLWATAGLVGIGGSVTSGVGARVSSVLEQGAAAASAARQRAADAFDPSHPPRVALSQDTEIDDLLRLNVGADVPGSATRSITVASVQRRADAQSPDAALYATLHSELRQPNDTKVFGVTVRSTRDPRDDYLYKGETVKIGSRLYKVNWISAERQQIALVAYRDQDHVATPVKATFD